MHVQVLDTFTSVSAASAASPAPTHPSIKEAALRAASTKGGGRLRKVEDFGLPKSAVGTVGQTSKIFRILNFDS